MKKVIFLALVAVFMLAFAGIAAAATPTVIYDGTNMVTGADDVDMLGASRWTYKDLADSAQKYEGAYASFDDTTTEMYDDPHGGYDTATNKCKVCHAVHRAEGAYYLLRADSQ
ncbi:MAG: hypothetical protein OEV43_06460, partial [Coriobacteriia bacterium]|nr:hypothetical protein [Coriobacteriia bacterium]